MPDAVTFTSKSVGRIVDGTSTRSILSGSCMACMRAACILLDILDVKFLL